VRDAWQKCILGLYIIPSVIADGSAVCSSVWTELVVLPLASAQHHDTTVWWNGDHKISLSVKTVNAQANRNICRRGASITENATSRAVEIGFGKPRFWGFYQKNNPQMSKF